MEFFDLVKSRKSIRMYTDEPVDDETVMKIIDTARNSPSAGNLQPYKISIVRDLETKQELAKAAYGQGFIARAPVVLVFLEEPAASASHYGRRGIELYVHQDTAVAVTFAHLAAADLGLGSCWIGAFDSHAAARILDLPSGLHPVAILPIGHPAENPLSSPKKEINQIIHPGAKLREL